jgi:peptide/nickel transport system substrate-binding protein
MVSQWDPAQSPNPLVDYPYLAQVYDRLLFRKTDGTLGPMLASSYDVSSDSLSITLKLRTDVTFQDGSPFDADVAVANLQRYQGARTPVAAQLSNVATIEKVDPATVKLTLKAGDPLVLYNLSWMAGVMVSAPGMANPASLSKSPHGSGPFKLGSATADTVVLDRNDNYWDKSFTFPAHKVMSNILDPNARLNAFQTGTVDVATVKLGDNYTAANQLVQAGTGKFFQYKSFAQYQVYINTKVVPLDNPEVRKALNMAIDRNSISQSLLGGQCGPSSSVAPEGFPGHVATDSVVKYDPAGAKKILEQQGVGTGFTIDAIYPNSAPFTLIAPAIQDEFKRIGVTLNLNKVEVQAALPTWRKGGSGIMVHQITSPLPDVVGYADDSVDGPNAPGGAPPEVVPLIEAARPLPIGSSSREQAEQKITKYLDASPLHLQICQIPQTYIYRGGVTGVQDMPLAINFDAPDPRNLGIAKG